VKRVEPLAPLDARRMKLMALSGQIRATYRGDLGVPMRLTVPQDLSMGSSAPIANVPATEETDGVVTEE
jgi:hypothetical protein